MLGLIFLLLLSRLLSYLVLAVAILSGTHYRLLSAEFSTYLINVHAISMSPRSMRELAIGIISLCIRSKDGGVILDS